MRAFLFAFVLLAGSLGAPRASTAQPPTAQAAVAAPAKPATPAAPAAEPYTYNPQGRRDPFVSLLTRGTDNKTLQGTKKAEGLGGLSVAELSVRGVMQSRGGYVAILQGPDNKTYLAHPSDRLIDGTIKSISERGLVIVQEVNDPLSLVKQREVRKGLRALDEGK